MTDAMLASAEVKRNYHTLDALRGIAALAVVGLHYRNTLAPSHTDRAGLAVDLFFLMSGFVIYHAYERRFEAGMGFRKFMLTRICRLYPLYAIGTLVTIGGIGVALALGKPTHWTWSSLLLSSATGMLMLPAWPVTGRSPDLYPLNLAAWSLGFEIAVNALFATMVSSLRAPRLGFTILLGAVALVAIAARDGSLDGGSQYPSIHVGLARTLFSFFLGVALCRGHRSGRWPAPRLPAALILTVMGALLLVEVPTTFIPAYDLVCILFLFPIGVWCALDNEPQNCVSIATVLGLISYPIYIINIPVQAVALGVFPRIAGMDAESLRPWSGMAIIAGLILLSWILARYVDPKLRRAMTGLLDVSARRA